MNSLQLTADEKADQMAKRLQSVWGFEKSGVAVGLKVKAMQASFRAIVHVERRLSGWASFWELLDAAGDKDQAAMDKMKMLPAAVPKSRNSWYTAEIHAIIFDVEGNRPANNYGVAIDMGDDLGGQVGEVCDEEDEEDGQTAMSPPEKGGRRQSGTIML